MVARLTWAQEAGSSNLPTQTMAADWDARAKIVNMTEHTPCRVASSWVEDVTTGLSANVFDPQTQKEHEARPLLKVG